MTDPRRPRPGRPDSGDPLDPVVGPVRPGPVIRPGPIVGPVIGPGPVVGPVIGPVIGPGPVVGPVIGPGPIVGPGPRPGPVVGPIPPPVPWTPFGPGDNATPDVRGILKQSAKTRAALEAALEKLTGERDGPGPDGTPPVVREVSRADGLWPFLLIRSQPGDVGARPLDPSTITAIERLQLKSPDIVVTASGPPGEPAVIDRDGNPTLQARAVSELFRGASYDVWVHVWNLGRSPASGVRVRVFLGPTNRFLGGRQVDLGDRLSATSHRVVKAATFTAGAPGDDILGMLIAVAECMSDVAAGDRGPGIDRHCGHRRMYLS